MAIDAAAVADSWLLLLPSQKGSPALALLAPVLVRFHRRATGAPHPLVLVHVGCRRGHHLVPRPPPHGSVGVGALACGGTGLRPACAQPLAVASCPDSLPWPLPPRHFWSWRLARSDPVGSVSFLLLGPWSLSSSLSRLRLPFARIGHIRGTTT
jgi:hypothetical protein